jgi:hypothetical protein
MKSVHFFCTESSLKWTPFLIEGSWTDLQVHVIIADLFTLVQFGIDLLLNI